MSNKKKRDYMNNLDKCNSVVQQNRKTGITADGIAKELNIHRSTVHNYLNTLDYTGKVRDERGLWYPKENTSVETPKEMPKETSDNFEFYLKHGFISKQQINAYTAIKVVLDLIPKNSPECNTPEYMALNLIVGIYDAKFKELKKLKDSLG